ncbi:DUF6286 domain-containing protein [Streptomyces sp. NPDC047108]|uniref:DUF6286 domain-containing protein n=1 Tax=Streptomyces sp. NPDC047108 TaxID=3155025 RepID=UPI0033C5D740
MTRHQTPTSPGSGDTTPNGRPAAQGTRTPLDKPPRSAGTSADGPSTPLPATGDDRRRRGDVPDSPHRPWSTRRAPAAVVALGLLLAAGTLLYEVVRVRTGHEAASWRKELADELATRPLDDVWVLTGAAVAAALGLWLAVLALTPGLRHHLPLRVTGGTDRHTHTDSARAVLDRAGARQLLRDAALRVPGVSRAKVRVRRRGIRVRADAGFRDLDEVRADLTDVLAHEQTDRLALARPLRLRVRVRRRPR